MIVSVTANTTLDHMLFVPTFEPQRTIRATRSLFSVGGKPTDASWILGEIGINSLALGFAAGTTRHKVEALLHRKNVTTDFIEVDGETRINTVIIVERENWQTTITTNTMSVSPAHLDALMTRYTEALETATVVVLGGTLPHGVPPDFYTTTIKMAKAKGVAVVFDAAEPNLSAGLIAQPDYIKPNRDELSELMQREIGTLADAYHAGRALYDRYGVSTVVTLGADGGLAVLPNRAYFIPTLPIKVASASGAGDGVLAGISLSLHLRQPIEEGLRMGFACAAAVCLMPGTADCRRADVEALLPQIVLMPYMP
jgi:1-phosphofructokinase family hexose kinase